MFVFFFNDPATTEIYTYCHTLSLHDALPIFVAALKGGVIGGGCELALAADIRVSDTTLKLALPEILYGVLPDTGGTQMMTARSDEHTSELQSLMRISYAVFCLKKKSNILT